MFQVKWEFHKSVHAHAFMIFPSHHFYVILQATGLGYLIGGSILVSDAAAYKFASDKLNFWRRWNKRAVAFDSIKTHSVGGTT